MGIGTDAAVAVAAIAGRRFVKALLDASSPDHDDGDASSQATEALTELVRRRLGEDPTWASTLDAVENDPASPAEGQKLQNALVDVVIMDDVFAGKLERLVARANGHFADADGREHPGRNAQDDDLSTPADGDRSPKSSAAPITAPVRGFLGLTAAATSPQTTAGSDFSIFVLVQNPFDVPVTIYQVQTHIPVELIDVNRLRAKRAELAAEHMQAEGGQTTRPNAWKRMQLRRRLRDEHPGVAVAVGTEFTPEEAGQLFRSEVNIGSGLRVEQGASANFSAVSLFLPSGASGDDLDAMMRRFTDYQRGVLPVRLQPGDSVVRQFVLRTRSSLLFRPLNHTFQIQVNYSVDGVDHTGTIPYQLSIQAALGSMVWGAALGSALGTLVKGLTSAPAASVGATARALAVSLMASGVTVVAFSRKSSAQPLVSVEDFWGGLVIGFAVGYFGFHQFLGLFPSSSGK